MDLYSEFSIMKKFILLMSLLACLNCMAESRVIADSLRLRTSSLPTSCPDGEMRVDVVTDDLYKCLSGAWSLLSGGLDTPGVTVDQSLVLFNGTDGASLTDSEITVTGSDTMSGIDSLFASGTIQSSIMTVTASLGAGDLLLDANVISSSVTNQDVVIHPSGTGSVTLLANVEIGPQDGSDTEIVLTGSTTNGRLRYQQSRGRIQQSNNNGSTWTDIPQEAGIGSYCLVSDRKSDGTQGGTCTSGAWRTRDLNTEEDASGSDCPFVSIATNVMTLDAGTYQVRGQVPSRGTRENKGRIYDTGNTLTLVDGTNADAADTGAHFNTSHSFFYGVFTLSASTTVEVQHRCSLTASTFGFGLADAWTDGDDEVYSTLVLRKVD